MATISEARQTEKRRRAGMRALVEVEEAMPSHMNLTAQDVSDLVALGYITERAVTVDKATYSVISLTIEGIEVIGMTQTEVAVIRYDARLEEIEDEITAREADLEEIENDIDNLNAERRKLEAEREKLLSKADAR